MPNELITIQGVRGFIDENGIAQLDLEDISRGLGFITTVDGSTYVRWTRVQKYLTELKFLPQVAKNETVMIPEFIPENFFYRLAMKANNEIAEKFQAIVANEILPSIRKTGNYVSGLSKELQAIFATDKKVQQLETQFVDLTQKVDNQITVTFNQAKFIQFAIASRIIEYCGGKQTDHYCIHKGSYFQQLHRDIKDRLGVPSYRDIRKLDYDIAVAYIKAWLPKAEDRTA